MSIAFGNFLVEDLMTPPRRCRKCENSGILGKWVAFRYAQVFRSNKYQLKKYNKTAAKCIYEVTVAEILGSVIERLHI